MTFVLLLERWKQYRLMISKKVQTKACELQKTQCTLLVVLTILVIHHEVQRLYVIFKSERSTLFIY